MESKDRILCHGDYSCDLSSPVFMFRKLLLLLRCFSRVRLCATPQTAAHQALCPWDSPVKNTGVGCHFLLQCMKVKSESEVAQLCPIVATPWTAAYQAPPSKGFSRQKYWSGVPLPSPIKVRIAAKNQLWRATHPNSPDRATGWSVCTEKGLLRNLF